jgi:hypothetical protein
MRWFRYCRLAIIAQPRVIGITNARAGRPARAFACGAFAAASAAVGDSSAAEVTRGYDGINTVSTTWMTPFDWLTFGIVTVELPPLLSISVT